MGSFVSMILDHTTTFGEKERKMKNVPDLIRAIQDDYDKLVRLMTAPAYLSYDELEELYAMGYNLFTVGNYENADLVFEKLTKEEPYAGHYWRALGAVKQQLKDYNQAIAAYDNAIKYEPTDPISYVYRAECRMLLGQYATAYADLESVLQIDNAQADYQQWVNRAQLLLVTCKQNLAKDSDN